jgi:hypothetical protein
VNSPHLCVSACPVDERSVPCVIIVWGASVVQVFLISLFQVPVDTDLEEKGENTISSVCSMEKAFGFFLTLPFF